MSLITLVSYDNKTVEIDIETALKMGTIRDLLLSTGAAGEEEDNGPPLPPRTPAPQVMMEMRMVMMGMQKF